MASARSSSRTTDGTRQRRSRITASVVGVAKALDAGQTIVLRVDRKRGEFAFGVRRLRVTQASSPSTPDGARHEGHAASRLRRCGCPRAGRLQRRLSARDGAAIDAYGWYNRNCAINPYLVEKKTSRWRLRSNWISRSRQGVHFRGRRLLHRRHLQGFLDLLRLGLIDRMPKITGVQAEGACPIHDAFLSGSERVTFGPGRSPTAFRSALRETGRKPCPGGPKIREERR